jgi:hypothetical protein
VRRAVAAGLAIVVSGQVAAADNPVFAGLVGDWIGDGMVRRGPDAEPERVFCRVTNAIVADGAALEQEGRCAVAANSGPIKGLITDLGSGDYGGTLESIATDGPATLSGTGTEDGSGLVLDTRFIDRVTGEPVISVTTIALVPEGGYRITSERTNPRDGETFTASEIVFSAN